MQGQARLGRTRRGDALQGKGYLELELPYPPSINHLYRRVGPRTLISREGRRFRERVCLLLAAAGVRRLNGPLCVEILVYPPDRRRRDVDNLQKALLDALQHGGAYRDDSEIKKLTIEMCRPVAGGKARLRICELRREHA